MSGGIKYPYAEAYKIALEIVEQLKPHCERIAIAGSIRRRKADCGDIEIVIIPKPYSTGLFENGIATIVNRWEKVKGELGPNCKYTQRILPCGIKLDLFFAEERNWGSVLAIRTGSSTFSHKILACGWSKLGFTSDGGYLYKDGIKYGFSEEEDLFDFLGIKYIKPEDRDY